MQSSKVPLLSVAYKNEINYLLKSWMKNYYEICSFGLFVILPNKEVLYTSTNADLSKVYVTRNFARHDILLKEEMYKNYLIYPWRIKKSNRYIEEITLTREKIFNLNAGTTYVRKLKDKLKNDYHIIYCVSTHNKNPMMKYVYACAPDDILEVCDFAYNSLIHLFQRYTHFKLPKIQKFIPMNTVNQNILENYTINENDFEKFLKYTDRPISKNINPYKIIA